jgi:predicted DNA-binding helix-hairpin-helix protein
MQLAGVHGRTFNLMRVMQTNACSLKCRYCATRCGRKLRRTIFQPEELASVFYAAHKKGYTDGLFLTSGIPGSPVSMMDKLLATLEILRKRYKFGGYIHMKILPGAEPEQIVQAARLASRISLNCEAPSDAALAEIAPEKSLSKVILPSIQKAGELWKAGKLEGKKLVPSGVTTQFMVGPGGERDREILSLVSQLEGSGFLHHAHFSTFAPMSDTPLENLAPTPFTRGFRLYQAEHLLRIYKFSVNDIPLEKDGNLSLEFDPKLHRALLHPELFPVEIKTASFEQLLTVPGIGPISAGRILQARKTGTIFEPKDLARLGVRIRQTKEFVTIGGFFFGQTREERREAYFRQRKPAHQLSLISRYPIAGAVSPGAFR